MVEKVPVPTGLFPCCHASAAPTVDHAAGDEGQSEHGHGTDGHRRTARRSGKKEGEVDRNSGDYGHRSRRRRAGCRKAGIPEIHRCRPPDGIESGENRRCSVRAKLEFESRPNSGPRVSARISEHAPASRYVSDRVLVSEHGENTRVGQKLEGLLVGCLHVAGPPFLSKVTKRDASPPQSLAMHST